MKPPKNWENYSFIGLMSDNANYTCNDYRQEMILLALQRKLAGADLSESEKTRIQEEIRRIEEQMGMR